MSRRGQESRNAPGPRTHDEFAQVGDGGGVAWRLGLAVRLLRLLRRDAEQGSDDMLAQEGEICSRRK